MIKTGEYLEEMVDKDVTTMTYVFPHDGVIHTATPFRFAPCVYSGTVLTWDFLFVCSICNLTNDLPFDY